MVDPSLHRHKASTHSAVIMKSQVKRKLLFCMKLLVVSYFIYRVLAHAAWSLRHHQRPYERTLKLSPKANLTPYSGEPPNLDAINFHGDEPQQINPKLSCYNKDSQPRTELRGNFWVLYNYIRAEKWFRCNETITYTTHSDVTFLDNLEPLLKRWQGPVSITIYSPGSDFDMTVNAILYYRECSKTRLVKDLVTFHVFFSTEYMPTTKVPSQKDLENVSVNCDDKPTFDPSFRTYRKLKGLPYPINVARNVARETANSFFVFPSDIELYPSPGLINGFLEMIQRGDQEFLHRKGPRIFATAIFEIEKDHEIPETKSELVKLIKKRTVVPFHEYFCRQCHQIPRESEWKTTPATDQMQVFHVVKRHPPFDAWEPIYIGTNQEPMYDELLSWEGRADKMTQALRMCLLDYDFMILNNAFLVHRPGIKYGEKNAKDKSADIKAERKQKALIKKTFNKDVMKILYGSRPDFLSLWEDCRGDVIR